MTTKFLQCHALDGSVQEIQQVPLGLETLLDNVSANGFNDWGKNVSITVVVPDGANGVDVASINIPAAMTLVAVEGYKTVIAAAHLADAISIKVGTSVVSTVPLWNFSANTPAGFIDKQQLGSGVLIDDATNLLAAGNVLDFEIAKTGANALSCVLTLTFAVS